MDPSIDHAPGALPTAVLRAQGMPSEEIRAILGTRDPQLVRRLFELHRERLDERLREQKSMLAWLEPLLTSVR